MGLVHTPRVIASIAKGLWKKRSTTTAADGLSHHPHQYYARAGLFDVDYLGHLNNAAYLNHAELARWEMTAGTGLLQAMVKNKVVFLVAGCAIRYRAEIRPIWRQFQVDTSVVGLDPQSMWITHNFRYPGDNQRVRAQMVIRGVAVQAKTVLDPREFFQNAVGADQATMDKLTTFPLKNESESNVIEELLAHYVALEDSFRKVAAVDDETQKREP
jgi:acyl-CoA thioesterase FadM